jgi:hypothetical protein
MRGWLTAAMKRPLTAPGLTVLGLLTLATVPLPAHASLLWNWSYTGDGIAASGTLTTVDDADGAGFYQITGITGARNGEAIIGLEPTGNPIPGNEPFAVDNLISRSGQQLTGSGFGYELADGNFANPFFADFFTPPSYLEFFSVPAVGGTPASHTELPVSFTAAVPEPTSFVLMLTGCIGLLGLARRRWQPARSAKRR